MAIKENAHAANIRTELNRSPYIESLTI